MPPDEAEIRATLERLPPVPADVSAWDVQTGTDSADEPAVRIWAVLGDENTDIDNLIAIRDLVLAHASGSSETSPGVHAGFRSVDEVREVK